MSKSRILQTAESDSAYYDTYYCNVVSPSVCHLSHGGTVVASPPPTGIGDPAVCGSQPLVTPISYVDLETRGFAVFLCFLVFISVKIDSR